MPYKRKTWERKCTAWVVDEQARVGPRRCIICEEPFPEGSRQRVLCGDRECFRVYNVSVHIEHRAFRRRLREASGPRASGEGRSARP